MPRHTKPISPLEVGEIKQVLFTRRYVEKHPDFLSWEQWTDNYWARESQRAGLILDKLPLEEYPQTVVSRARVTGTVVA